MTGYRRRSIPGVWLALAAAVMVVGAGCAGAAKRDQTPATLEAARRARYFIAPEVAVDGSGTVPPGTTDQLRSWVGQYMAQVGLPPATGGPRAGDVELRLSLSGRGGSVLLYGTAGMMVLAGGQPLDQLRTADHVEPAGNFARALARDLVESLVHSTRLAAHADATSRGQGPVDRSGSSVVMPAVAMSPGAPSAAPPVLEVPPATPATPPGSSSTAAARAHTRQAAALYDLNRFQEAYNEFEQAYLAEQDPALLYNMGQCQRKLGNSEEALHFYRTYLRRAPKGPSSIEAEKRVKELEDALARGRSK